MGNQHKVSLHGRGHSGHSDVHASETRWRHQESSSFALHAQAYKEKQKAEERDGHADASESRESGFVGVDEPSMLNRYVHGLQNPSNTEKGVGNGPSFDGPAEGTLTRVDTREVRCGPLLNYKGMRGSTWYGSVLIVTRGGISKEYFEPVLNLRIVNGQGLCLHDADGGIHANGGIARGAEENVFPNSNTTEPTGELEVKGFKLYADADNIFWRFSIHVEMQEIETQWEYRIPGLQFLNGKKTDRQSFFVPAILESMKVMFYSCNGFSVGTDENAWSGPVLWNDVLRVHKETPIHIMIGGGDQIYNDGIRVNGPLRPWSNIKNPKKRTNFPFSESLRKECDEYYVSNYLKWYSTEPFSSANGQIPQLNIWDDHDIIDGFGSYVDTFMKCNVFQGIGGIAYKYYMLFQHHLPPPVSTYSTDAPQIMAVEQNGVDTVPEQLKGTFVPQTTVEDPSYIIGNSPGPYIAERSKSIYARLGARIALVAVDARTERTRRRVNYLETYDLIFARIRKELGDAARSPSPIKHLIILLGIPIAYPRLTWLENILQSPLAGPIQFLNKRFGFAGSLFNHFDGSFDLLDDLDDHYTARTHKKERQELVLGLQDIAAEFSVRITILGGDVHLAALGRFYSNPKLGIPTVADHRYMANIISSAIVNKPPPHAIANLLAKRNKIHHLDDKTDETLLKLFNRDPGKGAKTASFNHVTMPSRNWTVITENDPLKLPKIQISDNHSISSDVIINVNNTGSEACREPAQPMNLETCTGRNGHSPLHPGEIEAGTENRAVAYHGKSHDGSLDVCIRVEKDRGDGEGHTEVYGMRIPLLNYSRPADKTFKR